MPSPIPRQGHEVRSFIAPRGGSLPRFHGGSAPALGVSRPAQRSLHVTACLLAESLNDPLHRGLRLFRYLRSRFRCYRLEPPVAGWELHPLQIRAFARRTRKRALSRATDRWGKPTPRQGTDWAAVTCRTRVHLALDRHRGRGTIAAVGTPPGPRNAARGRARVVTEHCGDRDRSCEG